MNILVISHAEAVEHECACIIRTIGHQAIVENEDEVYLSLLQDGEIDTIIIDSDLSQFAKKIKTIKQNNTTATLPFILLFCQKFDENITQEGLCAGADDILIKSSGTIWLQSKIQLLARMKEAQLKLDRLEHRLLNMTFYDSVTGLLNMRGFDSSYEVEWRRMIRERKSLATIMIEIDHLKLFSETHGRGEAEELLRTVAKMLNHSVLRPGDQLAHYGSGEFVALLPGTDLYGAQEVGERIRKALANLRIDFKESPISSLVTASMGIASTGHKHQEMSVTELLDLAYRALDKAKDYGCNQVVTFGG